VSTLGTRRCGRGARGASGLVDLRTEPPLLAASQAAPRLSRFRAHWTGHSKGRPSAALQGSAMQALAFGAAAAAAAAAALVVGGGRAGLAPSAALRATAAVVCAVAVAVVGSARRRRKTLSNARRGLRFVPWRELNLASWKSSPILVVDTTHPSRECLTHHKMRRLPPAELRDDTTTGMVLNALRQRHSLLSSFTGVSVDHFDIDAFLSVFAACNPGIAEQFDPVVREAAIIGDFRELDLSSPGADCALKVCCWINTQERKRFNRPFEGGDEDKWPFFLGEARFAALLSGLKESPDAGRDVWGEEHDRVLADIELLRTQGRVRRHEVPCLASIPPRCKRCFAIPAQAPAAPWWAENLTG
jgi:hypothetical protein